MAASPLKRKLSAILAADAVSYSRKMSSNEEGTMRVLSAHRAVIDGIIEFHEGRIVNTAGDSVLAEFSSPVEAVRCAVEIQDALRTRNDSLPAEQRLEFRVGVNLGDVMIKGDDLLGDGVNVASRLESIAEPGGICISSSIYDMIRGKLDLGFVDIGEQSLKNIEHPIRVYRVDRDGNPQTGRASVKQARRSLTPVIAGLAAIIALAAAWHWNLLPQLPGQANQQAALEAERQKQAAADAERQKQAAADAERRAKTEAELARARAEVEAARSKAKVEAAAAADAKRALEEQRAAASRAAAAAEIARARADAEATRRKADAELSAAKQTLEQARRDAAEEERKRLAAAAASSATVASAPKVAAASSYAGSSWTASLLCDPWRNVGASNFLLQSAYGAGGFELTRGNPDQPGYVMLRGNPGPDGRLVLTGNGTTGGRSRYPGTPYEAQFEGVMQSGNYEGRGVLGVRPCTVKLSRR